MRTVKVTLVAVALSALLASTARASDSDAVSKARAFLENEARAKGILSFAHPTATYRSVKYLNRHTVLDGQKQTVPGHFALRYNFNWKSELSGDTNDTELYFFFNDKGRFYSLKAGTTTSTFTPFSGANLVIALLKEAILEQVDKSDDVVAKKLIRQLISDVNARGIVELLLKLEQK